MRSLLLFLVVVPWIPAFAGEDTNAFFSVADLALPRQRMVATGDGYSLMAEFGSRWMNTFEETPIQNAQRLLKEINKP